jgi:hypothetical protein
MDKKFLIDVVYGTSVFLESLRKEDDPSYFPATKGLTRYGKKLSLGFSCYGVKLSKLNGQWDNLSKAKRDVFINYIYSFQNNKSNYPKNYYIDTQLIKSFEDKLTYPNIKFEIKKLITNLTRKNFATKETIIQQSINADNKQTIATLYEMGMINVNKSINLYPTKGMITNYLNTLDWNKPWSAGAQFSSLCVYSKTQGFDYESELVDFMHSKLHSITGSFHNKDLPETREIINGAMKVITGLEWLNHPIPEPIKLIDYCLENLPVLEGCDVVDFIYVLYTCTKQVDYRTEEVGLLLKNLSNEIMSLYHPEEKGFSYFKNRSQNYYYGTQITRGLNVADIHGTLLCTWGLVMVLDFFNSLEKDMSVIKP